MTRGERNNNPTNIRKSATKWAGMADEQTDAEFVVFRSPEYGIRAACRVLISYNNRGLNTVQKIIDTWAPPGENDSTAYVEAVCISTGYGVEEVLDVDTTECMGKLLRAIIHQENGEQPYSDVVIADAMRLAGVSDADPKPLAQSKTIKASTIAGAGTAVAAASQTLRQIQDINDTALQVRDTAQQSFDLLHWAAHFGPWVAIALVAIGICGIVYSKLSDRQRMGV